MKTPRLPKAAMRHLKAWPPGAARPAAVTAIATDPTLFGGAPARDEGDNIARRVTADLFLGAIEQAMDQMTAMAMPRRQIMASLENAASRFARRALVKASLGNRPADAGPAPATPDLGATICPKSIS